MNKISRDMVEKAEDQIYDLRETVSYDVREHTIEKIVKKYNDGLESENNDNKIYNFIYIPEYLRDFVWTESKQSKFIESVILGLPIPLVFVAESKNGEWEMIDGAQRIRTLDAFLNNKLTLKNLEKLDELNHFKFTDLDRARQRKFASMPIRLAVLSEYATDEVKKEMFERLNSGGLLKPMEKREEIYLGPFRDFIYKLCSKNELMEKLAPIDPWLAKRQEREELVLRYFALSDHDNYLHFRDDTEIAKYLDNYLEQKNKELEESTEREQKEKLKGLKEEFNAMLGFVDQYFKYGFRTGHNPQTKQKYKQFIAQVKMSYSDFKTLDQVNKKLGIVIKSENELYTHIECAELSPWFIETMKLAYTKAIRINTESSRQALIVDNVFIELNQHIKISFFLENTFNVDSDKGLTGNPDGIISSSENQLYITSPVVVLVQAKKSDLGSGLAQCIAEMEAARIFNEREENNIPIIYGVVTDGALWQFLSLNSNVAVVDSYLYNFGDGSQIVGILQSFFDHCN